MDLRNAGHTGIFCRWVSEHAISPASENQNDRYAPKSFSNEWRPPNYPAGRESLPPGPQRYPHRAYPADRCRSVPAFFFSAAQFENNGFRLLQDFVQINFNDRFHGNALYCVFSGGDQESVDVVIYHHRQCFFLRLSCHFHHSRYNRRPMVSIRPSSSLGIIPRVNGLIHPA